MIKIAWAFVSSKIGIAVVLVTAAAAVMLWLYVSGLRTKNALLELKAANAEAKVESLQRDIKAAEDATAKANEIIRDLSARQSQLDGQVRDYEKELESRPDSRCALTDSDVEWLRNIR